jgi:hypothetical protein
MDDGRKQAVLVIAASIVAAIRLNKFKKIDRTPAVMSKIADSVQIARLVLQYVERS